MSICVLEFSTENAAAGLSIAACNLPFKTLATEEWRVENVTLNFSTDWRARGLQTSCLYCPNTEMIIGLELKDT